MLITITILISLLSISCEKNPEDVSYIITDTLYAVCVIADFPDSKFEDMNYGVNSVEEVIDILHGIDQHWVWMSQGYQSIKWKLIRTTVSQTLSENSYDNSWYAYRQNVIKNTLSQLDVYEHDKDNDESIDIMFIIASDNNRATENFIYLIGGAAEVFIDGYGANTFVDWQSSSSVQDKVIGNFSHEIGHNLGLPDIYGPYDNVQYLTIMADSWPLPPHTFSAYEKHQLGWVEPQIINKTKLDIELESAETSLSFLKILTNNPLEFFLIEYRKRQTSSYTSSAPVDYDGIAIYKVNNYIFNGDVTLAQLAVIPADGIDYFGIQLAKTAFWYPENKLMSDTCSLKTNDGKNCDFILTDFKYTEKGMSLSVIFE